MHFLHKERFIILVHEFCISTHHSHISCKPPADLSSISAIDKRTRQVSQLNGF